MTLSTTNPPQLLDLKNGNVIQWMQNARMLYNPIEQARWNQSNIDSLFHAGEQRFINTYFQFFPTNNFQNFQFNLIQQPVNMVTGYQRQHRKNITYVPIEGSKQEFSDDLSTLETYNNSLRRRLEKFSKACEYAAITGMCLIQPYLDYRGEDPVNGVLDLEIWPYNSFFIDPFFRDAVEMKDCNFIWTQKYITKPLAKTYFPEHAKAIDRMTGMNKTTMSFYFLPENYNSVRNNFLILNHIWYQSSRTKKVLYNNQDGLTYEFYDDPKYIQDAADQIGFFEVIEVEVPTWNVAIVLNNEVMYNDRNPLGFDICPFIPVYWNYDPQMSQPELRVRSLTRPMRDVQFLMNRRIIINHDISESSINSGFIRIENAVVNEDDLKYSGQGKDIIIKQGNQITDVQKIIPNAVPPSDLQLADQLADLIFKTSGVNQELMGMASDTDTGIETMLKQGAGLITLQKYFDQWDLSLKQLGVVDKEIMFHKWSASKVSRILGKEAPLEFRTKIFSHYNVLVEEGVNTTVQQQANFLQLLKLNEMLGGIIPPKFLLEQSTIHNKNKIMEAVEEQQNQMQQMAQQEQLLKQTEMEARIQNIQSSSISNVAIARERGGRTLSNEALLIERTSELTQNRSVALKNIADALKVLVETDAMYGEAQIRKQAENLDDIQETQIVKEDQEEEKTQNLFQEQFKDFNLPQASSMLL